MAQVIITQSNIAGADWFCVELHNHNGSGEVTDIGCFQSTEAAMEEAENQRDAYGLPHFTFEFSTGITLKLKRESAGEYPGAYELIG